MWEFDEQLAAPFLRPHLVVLEVVVIREVVIVVAVPGLVNPVRVAVVFSDRVDGEAAFADVLVDESVL